MPAGNATVATALLALLGVAAVVLVSTSLQTGGAARHERSVVPAPVHPQTHHGHSKHKRTTHNDPVSDEPEAFQGTSTSFARLLTDNTAGETFKSGVVLHTDYGVIVWGFYDAEAPKSVHNFKALVHDGFYAKSCIYRYERGFVLQGGGCAGKSSQRTVPLEYTDKRQNKQYTVALARSSNPHSGGSEWFINLRDNTNSLGKAHKGGYTVFARVIDGFDTIAKLKKLPTRKGRLTLFESPQPKVRKAVLISAQQAA